MAATDRLLGRNLVEDGTFARLKRHFSAPLHHHQHQRETYRRKDNAPKALLRPKSDIRRSSAATKMQARKIGARI